MLSVKQERQSLGSKKCNKSKHADLVKLSPFLFQKSRQLHQSGVCGVKRINMEWTPTTEAEIWDLINESYERMSLEQRGIWELIKITPTKWEQDPFGNEGSGFWAVALIGSTVIWLNDIEDGFNRSSFKNYGIISEYYCNQDELEWQVQNVINQMRDGYDSSGYCSAPEPIA